MQPTIYEWPRCWRGTAESQFYLAPSNLQSVSPYTGQATPYGPQTQIWTAKLTFPTMSPRDHRGMPWRQVQGFITRLRGIGGMLRIVDYHRQRSAYDQNRAGAEESWSDNQPFSDGRGWSVGYLPPSIVADEPAREADTSVVVRGLPASLHQALDMGDLFEVRPGGIAVPHGHLYEVSFRADTGASGKTRLYFEPGLRKGVAAGDMIVLREPTSVFRLATDQEGIVQRGLASFGEMGMSLTEVLPWQ